MPNDVTWVGEVTVRLATKSYSRPPAFITVQGRTFAIAAGKAVREMKRRLNADPAVKGRRIDEALVKITRVREKDARAEE